MPRTASPFEAAYRAGVPAALPAPQQPERARRMPLTAPAAAGFALHGTVISPTSAAPGYVVVQGSTIADVTDRKPAGVAVVETDGVILPGLIDLHGHPEFNVFPAWEPPQQFANRYRWRSSAIYQKLVRDPQDVLVSALPARTELRYAEARALVGGVTAIQGASAKTAGAKAESLVRNVDLWIFGQHRARAMIDLPTSKSGRSWTQLKGILDDITAGTVDAFYLHLSEGRKDDERSQTEFTHFTDFGAATPKTVVIHATALSEGQLGDLADAGCRLVWSPQSNLRLYGETTLAGAALDRHMLVALGADWLPSGSTSLLAEMKVARRSLAAQGHPVAARDLVDMVTQTAAEVAGLGDRLGSLLPGRAADVLVLEQHHSDPYENVCRADPSWVEMVLVDGDVVYGRADWFADLTGGATSPTIEPLLAWGKGMLLDTGYEVTPDGAVPPSLSALRAALIAQYPQVGPICV